MKSVSIRTHSLAYVSLAALFLLSVAAFGQRGYDTVDLVRHGGDYVRPPFYLGDANWGAIEVQPEAEAAGMKFADTVLTVNGRPIDGYIVYYGAIRRARVGDRLQVQVQYPGTNTPMRDLSIELRPHRGAGEGASVSEYVALTLRVLAMPAVCISLGFWVAAVRIGDRSAWLFLILLLSLPASFGGGTTEGMFGRDNVFQPLFAGFAAFCGQIVAPALMLFGIAFPERLPFDRRFPWLKWIVAGYLIVVALLAAAGVGLWVHHLAFARTLTKRPIEFLTGVQGNFGAAVSYVALIVCAASLGWKAMTAPSRDARRRLLLLFVGAVPGVLSLLVVLVASRFGVGLPPWSLLLLMAMMFGFPLTMAYVIVVHRAMDVRVVIRQSLQYMLARGGIRAIQVALAVAVTIGAASLLSGGAGFVRVALVVAGMAAIVAIGGRFAERLHGWVDRRFFREAYEADAILSDLASRVRTMLETGPLLETVAGRVAESLHVPRIAILLNEGGVFRTAYALGYGATPRATLSERSLTVTRLRTQEHALVEFDNADSWVQLTDGEERATLEQLKPELLLPLSLNETVLGIMSLGPKQSEEPFSKTDIRLLDSVAAQTGLALENGRLTDVIKAEVAAREKQRREIEIAHEVQERLFPQEYPPVAGLDYAGACRPALGVGGDYYDFIHLSKSALGIAIGDVSGKGIPAALLMATLRAYLRGQTVLRQADLAALMTNLNRLVYESSAANRYATFFYAELDVASRTLDYVNGGHNPPMVFRHSNGGQEVVRLDTGGPVIGLMEDCCYSQGRVVLEPGDVLVAYTDGVSEAMNASDDEWGEERMMDAVRPNRTVTARLLIEQLMASADAFVAGAPQHDDMTLIVVRAI